VGECKPLVTGSAFADVRRPGESRCCCGAAAAAAQGEAAAEAGAFTLVRFSAEPKPFWSHLLVSPCLIDWVKIKHLTYPTKCAYVEQISGRV